jgi:hypothetical protein
VSAGFRLLCVGGVRCRESNPGYSPVLSLVGGRFLCAAKSRERVRVKATSDGNRRQLWSVPACFVDRIRFLVQKREILPLYPRAVQRVLARYAGHHPKDLRLVLETRFSNENIFEEILWAVAHDVVGRGMSKFVQECSGHEEDERSSFVRKMASFALCHDIVELPPDPDGGRTALLAPFHSASLTYCERAMFGGLLVQEFELYALGQGDQLVVDGAPFVAGELAYASVGGVLFWDVRRGHVSELMWNSRVLVVAVPDSEQPVVRLLAFE